MQSPRVALADTGTAIRWRGPASRPLPVPKASPGSSKTLTAAGSGTSHLRAAEEGERGVSMP